MSYKERLSQLERDGDRSLTGQIVDAIAAAIDAGELGPGQKLPPTRELAGLAGVNHLTAARAYRQLAGSGLVASRVGSGTFVRGAAAAAVAAGAAGGSATAPPVAPPPPMEGRAAEAWQHYALPEPDESYGDRMLDEMLRTRPGGETITLMVGCPDEGAYPVERLGEIASEAMATEGGRALTYAEIEGIPELRAALARLGEARGLADPPERIVVTAGAAQALTLVARAVLRPGDEVACESPSFTGVLTALRSTGARVLPVPVDEAGLDTDALEQLLRRHEIRLLALQPRLQNPTGIDLAPDRRERLVELARRHGFFVLEDGVYGDLRLEGEDPAPLRALAPEHVIYVDSISKTVGGGLRIGWVAASGPVRDRIAAEKRNDDTMTAVLPQLIVARFLASGAYAEHLGEVISFHRERRDAMGAAIAEHLAGLGGAAWPAGGAHFWVALSDSVDERDLYDEAARRGVNFVPGGAAMPERPRRTFLRLSFCLESPERINEGVRRLADAIRAVRGARRPEALPIA